MKDFVTIIIPTFERPNACEKCVKNLLKQTYKNFEIVVIDDSCKKKYNIKDTGKVRYLKTEKRLGLGKSKNLGIKLARGNIIVVVDDDIILKPDYIDIIVGDLKKYKAGAVGGRLLYPQLPNMGIRDGSLVKISKLTGEIYAWFSKDTKKPVFVETMHACVAFWKKIAIEVNFFDSWKFTGNYTYMEPDFFNKLLKRGYKLLYEPKAIAYHYQLKEGGTRMSDFMYNMFTFKNSFFYFIITYKFKAIYMWPFYMTNRFLIKRFR